MDRTDAGFISLIEIQNLVRKRTNRTIAWIFAIFTLLTGSLGIYVGRYVRLNSWDVAADPIRVYTDIFQHFGDRMLRVE
jgi:uncharacterized membrane protein